MIVGTNRPGSNTRKVAAQVEEIYGGLGVPLQVLDLAKMPPEIFSPSSYGQKPKGFLPFSETVLAASGLVVVTPATPADNFGLLKAAIRCDDPVVYMEHKDLWAITGEIDESASPLPLGKARRIRDGSDVTVVTWSGMLRHVEAAADLVAGGPSIDVIDLRTLYPWDREMVFASVARSGRLLIVHEAVQVGGFGGEIAATVGEELFDRLKAPIRRLGAPRIPVPYAPQLEEVCRISPAQIAETVRAMMR